jgi:hypothetical protein
MASNSNVAIGQVSSIHCLVDCGKNLSKSKLIEWLGFPILALSVHFLVFFTSFSCFDCGLWSWVLSKFDFVYLVLMLINLSFINYLKCDLKIFFSFMCYFICVYTKVYAYIRVSWNLYNLTIHVTILLPIPDSVLISILTTLVLILSSPLSIWMWKPTCLLSLDDLHIGNLASSF